MRDWHDKTFIQCNLPTKNLQIYIFIGHGDGILHIISATNVFYMFQSCTIREAWLQRKIIMASIFNIICDPPLKLWNLLQLQFFPSIYCFDEQCHHASYLIKRIIWNVISNIIGKNYLTQCRDLTLSLP